MTQPTKLYYNTKSLFSSVIRVYLHEKGVALDELVHLDLSKGEQNTPEFHSINPLTKVPVFVLGSVVIPDSQEITRYVEKTFTGLKDLTPTHIEESAQLLKEMHDLPIPILTFGARNQEEVESKSTALQLFKVRHSNIKKAISSYPEIAKDLTSKLQGTERLLNTLQNFSKVQEAWEKTENFLNKTNLILENRTYLDGDKYTYVDSHFTAILARISNSGNRQTILKYPNLAKYWETVQARESYKAVFNIPCNLPDHPKGCTCR